MSENKGQNTVYCGLDYMAIIEKYKVGAASSREWRFKAYFRG